MRRAHKALRKCILWKIMYGFQKSFINFISMNFFSVYLPEMVEVSSLSPGGQKVQLQDVPQSLDSDLILGLCGLKNVQSTQSLFELIREVWNIQIYWVSLLLFFGKLCLHLQLKYETFSFTTSSNILHLLKNFIN